LLKIQILLILTIPSIARPGYWTAFLPTADQTAIGQNTGLLSDSVIMTDNLATILIQEITRKIGVYQNMSAVDNALRHTLAL
jgi:mRNA interferase MazF